MHANAVRILVHPVQRLIDFFQQFLLPLLDPHREVLIHFRGRLIADIRKRFRPLALGESFPRFIEDGLTLFLEVTPDGAVLSASCRRLSRSFGRNRPPARRPLR
jgi:hypothetical protein